MDLAKINTPPEIRFSRFDFEPHELTIENIAQQLSRLHRWAGRGMIPINVAYHSYKLWENVPAHLKAAALLHDVSEMKVGEIPDPVKKLSPEIMALEEYLQQRVFNHFRVPLIRLEELHFYDKAIANDERKALFGYSTDCGLDVEFTPVGQEEAAMLFKFAMKTEFMV